MAGVKNVHIIVILNIFFSLYYGGNHDIICLCIMFLPRCLKHITVIYYSTFCKFPRGNQRQVLLLHFVEEVTG